VVKLWRPATLTWEERLPYLVLFCLLACLRVTIRQNPETDYGIYVKDNDELLITTESLASSNGQPDIVYDLGVQFNLSPFIILGLVTRVI